MSHFTICDNSYCKAKSKMFNGSTFSVSAHAISVQTGLWMFLLFLLNASVWSLERKTWNFFFHFRYVKGIVKNSSFPSYTWTYIIILARLPLTTIFVFYFYHCVFYSLLFNLVHLRWIFKFFFTYFLMCKNSKNYTCNVCDSNIFWHKLIFRDFVLAGYR